MSKGDWRRREDSAAVEANWPAIDWNAREREAARDAQRVCLYDELVQLCDEIRDNEPEAAAFAQAMGTGQQS
jgi:hypothetical protein